MNIFGTQVFKKYIAPGYLNFSGTQQPYTAKISNWFNLVMQQWVSQGNLFDSFFRTWMTHDYSTSTVNRTPYIGYLLSQYGVSWFNGSDTQAAALIGYISKGYSGSTSSNINSLFNILSTSPFFWVITPIQIVHGQQYPAISQETLIIYSISVSLPVTPSPQAYTARAWAAPIGWSQTASSATFFSRGYLSGGNIIWMSPQSTSTIFPFYDVANIAGLPVAPVTGSLAGVFDDSTGDVSSVYYYDGAQWRKTTTTNVDQGQVTTSIPTPQPRAVSAPLTSSVINSATPPPVSGPSQGYGMYAGLSQTTLSANQILLSVILTDDGLDNIGMIINLLRRIKPSLNRLVLSYSLQSDPNTTGEVEILDSGAII